MSQQTPKPTPTQTNPFNPMSGFPPLLPMVVIAIVLVSMAQFPSTEGLAAAFAWLIFVSVLMADGIDAMHNLTHLLDFLNAPTQPGINQPGGGGGGKTTLK